MHGLVAAAHTPFQDDGTLAPEVVETQAAFLSANGIATVFVTGSTGESHSLTTEEKMEIHEAWAAASQRHGLHIVAHVGGNSVEDAKLLAARCRHLGLAAVGALAPSYYKPADVAALVDVCASIAAAADGLPFYFYDIPALTGVEFPMDDFIALAAKRIPNLAGIKYTNADLVGYLKALNASNGRFDLPWGVDEAMLQALATGARGFVGSTYNWAPQLYNELMAAYDAGDMARARSLQTTAVTMIDAVAAAGFLGSAKALMGRLGVPVGPARLPLGNPTPDAVEVMMRKLEAIGFADWGASPVNATHQPRRASA
jgi:N-acetylneuraminate lyase